MFRYNDDLAECLGCNQPLFDPETKCICDGLCPDCQTEPCICDEQLEEHVNL